MRYPPNSQQQWFPTLNSVISRLIIAYRAPANDQYTAKSLIKKYIQVTFIMFEPYRYGFTCKQLSVPVFVLLKAPPAGNRLKLQNRLLTSPSCQLDTYTHIQKHTHTHTHNTRTCTHTHTHTHTTHTHTHTHFIHLCVRLYINWLLFLVETPKEDVKSNSTNGAHPSYLFAIYVMYLVPSP